MCGLAGIYSFQKNNHSATIKVMTDCIAHRGPDADGFYINDTIALGHRRLSIIDLSEQANQPLYDVTKNYVIIFNGELYNYKELKAELKQYPFNTNSDTEVVLAAYLQWGEMAVERLIGMFAFAIYNVTEASLFIARDRLGVKPIYYYQDENCFIFASEMRPILKTGLVKKEIDTEALLHYLKLQSFYAPNTVIKNIKQLEAAHYISISNTGISKKEYWNITKPGSKFEFGNEEQVKKEVHQKLLTSVQRRLVSDVPVAAFLSGGIDSSAVVGLMAQYTNAPQTFNIAFAEEEYDESGYAEIIAKKFNTRHHKILLKPETFLDELPSALKAMDIPSGDGINSYVVSKQIVKNNIKVAMSGVGGDELFAGYPSFKQWASIHKKKWLWNLPKSLRTLPFQLMKSNHKTDRIKELLSNRSLDINDFYALVRQIWSEKDAASLIKNSKSSKLNFLKGHDLSTFPLLSQFSIAELLGYTSNTLLKDTDQFSMAVSLEVREPFFDHELIEYVLQIPDSYKYPIYPKKLLVESLGDLLPQEIVHRKKQGFTFPWKNWMQNELAGFCQEKIQSFGARSFVNTQYLDSYYEDFKKGNKNWQTIWLIVVLENWLSQHID